MIQRCLSMPYSEQLAKNLTRTRHLEPLTFNDFNKVSNLASGYTIEGFAEGYSLIIKWGDEDFEKYFILFFDKYFKSQYEWLVVRLAYMSFSFPYSQKIPQEVLTLKKDKEKFLNPYRTARNQIKDLYKLRGKDSTKILKEIDGQITLLKYSLSGSFGRRIFKKEAKSILREMPMKEYKIKEVMEKFSEFRKSFL